MRKKSSGPTDAVDIFRSIGVVLSSLKYSSSFILAATSYLLIFGWVESKSYFGEFGAGWIVNEMSAYEIMGRTPLPGFILLWLVFYGLRDLFIEPEQIRIKTYPSWYIFLLTLVPTIVGSAIPSAIGLGIDGRDIFRFLGCMAWTIIASIILEAIVVQVRYKEFEWNPRNFVLVLVFSSICLYFFPSAWGSKQAMLDMDEWRSGLPRIYLRKELPDASGRRLLATTSRGEILAVSLSKDTGEYPRIIPVSRAEVASIRGIPFKDRRGGGPFYIFSCKSPFFSVEIDSAPTSQLIGGGARAVDELVNRRIEVQAAREKAIEIGYGLGNMVTRVREDSDVVVVDFLPSSTQMGGSVQIKVRRDSEVILEVHRGQ